VLVRFEVDEDNEDVEPYPAKVLAMYEDIEGNFKVLVHSVAYKTPKVLSPAWGHCHWATGTIAECKGSPHPHVFGRSGRFSSSNKKHRPRGA
jgi:hypothetical protein